MSTDERNVEMTTQFIRKLVAEDVAEQEDPQNSTGPIMVQVPFEEIEQARLMLRQFIHYLKTPDEALKGARPMDSLKHEELKRFAWVYERRIKAWLAQGEARAADLEMA